MSQQPERTCRTLDIVVPVFNEEQGLAAFHRQLAEVLDGLAGAIRVVYINDGSSDGTAALLRQLVTADTRVVVLELSRNFGHQSALTAGLDHADADGVIMMDGDGQHPPQVIPQMLAQFRAGYDIVLTQRVNDQELSLFKRKTSLWFYSFINRIGQTRIVPGAADFRLLSRQVVDTLKQMPEYHRFLRGMIAWVGFRSVILPYAAPQRLAGYSKYSFRKMLKLAMDAIFSFSLLPLHIGLLLGFFFFMLAGLEIVYVLQFWLRGREDLLVPGWSSLMFMILIVGGFLMMLLGFIGIYVGYIFQELKRRPQYVLKRMQPESEPTSPRNGGTGATEIGPAAERADRS